MTRIPVLLRLEGLAALTAATTIYWLTGGSWLLFAVLFLAPDVFMAGYLRDARTGASIYNLGHTYLVPSALIAVGYAANLPLLTDLGLIWAAHIGLDRMLGFGLKLPTHFKHTHLQAVDDAASTRKGLTAD